MTWPAGLERGSWTPERRHIASVNARRRLGIPDGFRQIYGCFVPDEHAEPMRYWAYLIGCKFGRPEGERFVREQVDNDFPDIEQIREAWCLKRGAAEIRELIRIVRWRALYARYH